MGEQTRTFKHSNIQTFKQYDYEHDYDYDYELRVRVAGSGTSL